MKEGGGRVYLGQGGHYRALPPGIVSTRYDLSLQNPVGMIVLPHIYNPMDYYEAHGT